jgi:hypothetical protein
VAQYVTDGVVVIEAVTLGHGAAGRDPEGPALHLQRHNASGKVSLWRRIMSATSAPPAMPDRLVVVGASPVRDVLDDVPEWAR